MSEAVVAIGLTGLVMLILVSISVFSTRSFMCLTNYVDMNEANRLAMDQISKDLRACNRVISWSQTGNQQTLALEDWDGSTLTYTWDSPNSPDLENQGKLRRIKAGIPKPKVLLTGCDTLTFNLGQRNLIGGTFDTYPASDAASAKAVNISWKCSRTILGQKVNTETVQTARIVIRKQ